MKLRLLATLSCLCLFAAPCALRAAVVTYDLNAQDLVTPPSSATDGTDGNSAIGVWFNMQSGEAYICPTAAGITGKTDLADGRFQLRQNTAFTPAAAQVLVQGLLAANSLRGTTTVVDGMVAGQVARYGVGQIINSSGWSAATYVDLAGTFGVWNAKGRGFIALRFRIGTTLRYGYADITILPDNRVRLNGIAYESTANTAITPAYIGALPPAAATGLTVTGTTGTTVGLSWTDNSANEIGFKIERKLPAGTIFTLIATVNPNVTAYTDQGLSPSTSYVYRVIATTGGDAAPTNEVTGTTLLVSNPPAAPTNLVAAPSTPTSIRLTWTDNANDEVGVKIERALGSGAFSALATTGPGSTSYFDINLTPGSTYRYRVTATNGLDSTASNEASGKPFTLAETIGLSAANATYPAITGAGVTLGLWDFGTALATHAEFATSRVTNVNTSAAVDTHTTHAAGIAVAGGADPAARGVAPAASLSVYDSTNDETEMRAIGMQWPGQSGRIQAASASYGPIRGWNPTTSGTSWVFNVSKVGGVAPTVDTSFGAYGSFSRDADQTASLTPYLIVVRSAGNDRDDVPSSGQFVYLSLDDFNAGSIVLFNPATHPLVDGGVNGGFGSLADAAAAKNVITVGAVNGVQRDALTGLIQGAPAATTFSGWGPTNDGRVKPDLMALGVNVRSSGSETSTTYAVITGTSQAAPQVSAAAGLLTQAWSASGTGRYLRASTLKALLLHTADDLETPGPDARTGWGLLNIKAALDQLQAHVSAPAAGYLREGRLAAGQATATYTAQVAAGGNLRVTLAWTDAEAALPASPGSAASLLVRDLDLVVTGPTGLVYRPYVLPYALNTSAGRGDAATTGINRVDTVEQVRLAGLPAGAYRVEVTTASSLASGAQYFSLVTSGGVAPASAGPAPTLVRATAESGVAEILGDGFQLGARVVLTGPGPTVINATGLEVTSNHIRFRHTPATLATGSWKVEVFNPDGTGAFARWAVGAGVAAGFEGWQQALYTDAQLSSAALAAPGADPDADGFPQLAAYAFGSASGSVPSASRPVVSTADLGGGSTALKLTYVRRVGATDVAIVAENAAELSGPWNALAAGQYGAPVALGGGLEQVTATDSTTLGPGARRFLRLRVSRL